MGFRKRNILTCLLVIVATALFGTASPGDVSAREKIVFVSLFENLSKIRSSVSYDTGPKNDLDFKSKKMTVDRYSEIPRSLLEDELTNWGVKIVERQSLNKMLEENQFAMLSGLVDSSTALKVGKMIGANILVCGTIIDIAEKSKNFTGYGIQTKTTQTICNLRVRVVDISTGRVLYSKTVKGISNSMETPHGGESDSDAAVTSIENSIKEISQDENFKKSLL
ncbi:MAG: CsgG/HfaB family protein [Desulfobulbaceae bacterium]|nr:CsgG/HfaB family protein [Desulfobulbaceae bacterium]HIJ90600.1 hypothetical protein [Deltaproteobacteria bacterium]